MTSLFFASLILISIFKIYDMLICVLIELIAEIDNLQGQIKLRMQGSKAGFITADNGNCVMEAYKQLNKMIDDMDKKVEHVIKKHQSQFLYAYRNHIAKIKKQLSEIKHKSEEQEKMFSSNDRIQYLQKQMVIFRQEALKLYSKMDEKIQQNQFLKGKIRQFEKEAEMKEFQEKQKMRSIKVEEMNKTLLQVKIEQLQIQLSKKQQEITKLHRKTEVLKEENLRRSVMDNKVGSLSTSRRRDIKDNSKSKKVEIYDSEIKDWFLDCVRTVKREIAMRNSNGSLLDLGRINNIDQFKTVDKLRLLELFLQNEKLLTWMYERIFPDRLSQLRYKLSHNESQSNNSEQRLEQMMSLSQIQKRLLPKVGRTVRSQLRNSVTIKNGKLNISQI